MRLTDKGFNELHRACEQALITLAFGIVRDNETAKDIVGDSFMELWERKDNVEFTNVRAYLFQTVKNKCLDWRRREKIGRSIHDKIARKERDVMDFFTKSIECCDPNELFCSEIVSIYMDEVEQMPELTKKIFIARKIEGKSYKEVSASLNIDFQKIDKELRKAVVKLRRSLKDYLTILVMILFW